MEPTGAPRQQPVYSSPMATPQRQLQQGRRDDHEPGDQQWPGPSGSAAADRVRQTRVLRVGTPGDYPPFATTTAAAGYEGVDVVIAEALAEALGLQLRWVRTSWSGETCDCWHCCTHHWQHTCMSLIDACHQTSCHSSL